MTKGIVVRMRRDGYMVSVFPGGGFGWVNDPPPPKEVTDELMSRCSGAVSQFCTLVRLESLGWKVLPCCYWDEGILPGGN